MTGEKKLMEHVQEVLKIKDERNKHGDKKADYYQKFKFHLGKEQEFVRQLNEKIEEFEDFRIKNYKRGSVK